MADNVALPAAAGRAATDEVSWSGDADAQVQLVRPVGVTGAEGSKSVVPIAVTTDNPGPLDAAQVVAQKPQDTWTCSFAEVGSSLVTPDFTQRRLGTGVGVTQASSNLLVTAGTTANAEFLARSVKTFNGAFIERHQVILSQRIANNNFAVLLADLIGEGLSCTVNSATSISVTKTAHGFTSANVGQSMFVGAVNGVNGVPGRYAISSIPDANTINFTVAGWPASGSCTVDLFGWNYLRTLYNGTTATNAAVDSQRKGWASGDTTATINTTASPGHIVQTALDGRNVYWSDALAATSTTPAYTTRASRYSNIVDQDVTLYLYLWSYNGTSAPASGTTWTIGFVSVEDTCNVPVYLAGTRHLGQGAAVPVAFPSAQSVSVSNTPAVTINAGTNAIGDVGFQYRANATGAGTGTNLNSPATPAVQTIKGSAGRLIGLYAVNTNASIRFLKVFNATAPTLGTTSAALDIPLPPNIPVAFDFEGGVGFATAITCAVTGARGLTDNTAITANDVTGFTVHA